MTPSTRPARARVLPIQRQTVTSMATDALRDRILRGVYPEGDALRQDALAAELGVSRIPVREALRQLEAEGLVTFTPHRGAVVSSLSLEEIDEIFALRAELETDLLRRAISRISDDQLDRAEQVLDDYEAALLGEQLSSWGELNWRFHSTLYAPAGRRLTMDIVRRLHQQCDRYLRMQLALTHGASRANVEHRAIAGAARRRDATRAALLLRQHILGAGRSLLDFLRVHRAGHTPSLLRAR